MPKSTLYVKYIRTSNNPSVMQSVDPWFAQNNPWIVPIHTLRTVQPMDYCAKPGSINCAGQSVDCIVISNACNASG